VRLDLKFQRRIAAAPDRVFDAFTDPVGQREFYGQDAAGWIVDSRCDLRVGGVWSVSFGPSPDELYHHHHVFDVIDRPRRIRIASTETRLDGSSFDTTLEFTFEPTDTGTLMTMVQAGFPSEGLRDEHTAGLRNAFNRLERTLDRLHAQRALHNKQIMSNSVLYMSMSLDGFITGPGDEFGQGLGQGGERLHDWLGDGNHPGVFRPSGPSGDIFNELMATGAVLVGRRTFDLAAQWNGDHHGVPIFVPTREKPPAPASEWIHYVTNGIESAMSQAKHAAGDANVLVHGADLAQSCLRAGVLDELEIHLIPVLLGTGRPLFGDLAEHIELELTRVVDAPGVTHMRFRVKT
jgi:dihydrofolate reductase/uncharacterized protein YndB with AHSA1/START domain